MTKAAWLRKPVPESLVKKHPLETPVNKTECLTSRLGHTGLAATPWARTDHVQPVRKSEQPRTAGGASTLRKKTG